MSSRTAGAAQRDSGDVTELRSSGLSQEALLADPYSQHPSIPIFFSETQI